MAWCAFAPEIPALFYTIWSKLNKVHATTQCQQHVPFAARNGWFPTNKSKDERVLDSQNHLNNISMFKNIVCHCTIFRWQYGDIHVSFKAIHYKTWQRFF